MNPSVFFKIKDSHFMGQMAGFQYDPIFKGIETFNLNTNRITKNCFNMTRFSRGLRQYQQKTNLPNLSVSIWPDFQGDWDLYFSKNSFFCSLFQYDPIFKGIETIVIFYLYLTFLIRFNMTRFSRGLRL